MQLLALRILHLQTGGTILNACKSKIHLFFSSAIAFHLPLEYTDNDGPWELLWCRSFKGYEQLVDASIDLTSRWIINKLTTESFVI